MFYFLEKVQDLCIWAQKLTPAAFLIKIWNCVLVPKGVCIYIIVCFFKKYFRKTVRKEKGKRENGFYNIIIFVEGSYVVHNV